jgi:hypothetical protein
MNQKEESTEGGVKIRKHNITQIKLTGMKYLILILLLVAILINAGCVGGNNNAAVTPTPQIIYVTVTVTPTSIPTIKSANIQLTESSSTISPIITPIDNFDYYIKSDTQIKTQLNATNRDLSNNMILDLVTDGQKLKDIADREQLNLNPNDEYKIYLFSVSKLGNDLDLWGTAYRNKHKEIALGYADVSLKDIQDIDVILYEMKSSDRYFSFSEVIQDEIGFFEVMKGNIKKSKDYTNNKM